MITVAGKVLNSLPAAVLLSVQGGRSVSRQIGGTMAAPVKTILDSETSLPLDERPRNNRGTSLSRPLDSLCMLRCR